MPDIVEILQKIIAEPPRESDDRYAVDSFIMLLLYEEFDRHVKAGNPPHRHDSATEYAYFRDQVTKWDGMITVNNWLRYRHQLDEYIHEIQRLRSGRELSAQDRVDEVMALITQYGGIDGEHHKTWVIDQTVRLLVGPKYYPEWVTHHCNGEDGPDSYDWNEGIAP